MQGGPGIPKLYGFQTEGGRNLLAIEFLDGNLEKLFRICHKKFSIETAFALGEQMVLYYYK